MRLIIHDLAPPESEITVCEHDTVLPALGPKAPCTGCFGCWIKTPGKCVLKDRIKDMGAQLASCDELILITKSLYGGFSAETKNILDRSISYLLPFFRNINKEQHHKPRYTQQFALKVIIRNPLEISEEEKIILEQYIKAVALNLNTKNLEITYITHIGELIV